MLTTLLAISFIVLHNIFLIASLPIYFPFLSQFMLFSSFGYLVFFQFYLLWSYDLIMSLLVALI
jgi:hypothetical protein